MGDWHVQKKQIEQARTNFKIESEKTERDLRIKLSQVNDQMKEVLKEEHTFEKKENEFEQDHN